MKAAYPPLNLNDVIMEERRKAGIFVEPEVTARDKGSEHYLKMGVQPWDVVSDWPIEQQIGAYRLSALKYVMRMGTKDEQLVEVIKGIHCLEKLAEVLKGQK